MPNEININDDNSPIFFVNYYGNSLNQKNNQLKINMKIEDYFQKDQDNKYLLKHQKYYKKIILHLFIFEDLNF